MKEQHKKVLIVGGIGVVALMVLGAKDVSGTTTNIFESIKETIVVKETDSTDGFVSPDPDMTYKQWSAGYQKHLVEKYPINSVKRPDTKITILDVLNVGGEAPFDIKTGKPLVGKYPDQPPSSIYAGLGKK